MLKATFTFTDLSVIIISLSASGKKHGKNIIHFFVMYYWALKCIEAARQIHHWLYRICCSKPLSLSQNHGQQHFVAVRASTLLKRLYTRFWSLSVGICAHSIKIAFVSQTKRPGSQHFSSSQWCWTGLRSDLCAGTVAPPHQTTSLRLGEERTSLKLLQSPKNSWLLFLYHQTLPDSSIRNMITSETWLHPGLWRAWICAWFIPFSKKM